MHPVNTLLISNSDKTLLPYEKESTLLTENLTINDLFTQLGLSNGQRQIDNFIDQHRGLAQNIRIEDAPFWTPSQSNFLCVSLQEDAEWAELIDQLSALLR